MSRESESIFAPGAGLSRRQFLKLGAVAGAAGTAGTLIPGCSGAEDVHLADYPDVPENHVQLEPNGKSVLILGGGFGGMHAACELVDRGFKVTVVEKTSALGGKLKSYRDRSFGIGPTGDPNWKGYPRDHGAHAVWGFYNNLREFIGRHGMKLHKLPPRDITMYHFLDRDGTAATMGYTPKSRSWPFNWFEMIDDNFRALAKINGSDSGFSREKLLKILAFDHDDVKERMYLDSLSFPEWARAIGMPERLIYRFFGPVSEMAMFDSIDRTSALYILNLLHLAMGHPHDLAIDIFQHPPGETYAARLEEHIRSRGGDLILNTSVVKVNRDGGRVKSVLVGEEAPAAGAKSWRCRICGNVFGSSAKPHKCPFCSAPLDQIEPFAPSPPRELVADYYVVAMDTPGAKEIAYRSNLAGETYFDNIQKLDSTSVFPVNLWYAGKSAWSRRFPQYLTVFPSGFRYLGITLNWAFDGTINGKKVTEPFVPEYASRDITVLETQIPSAERVAGLEDEEIARLVHEELRVMMPDLPDPTDFYLNRWTTYSPQRVGYEALRPPIQSPIDNLFFIGDWVRTDHQSVYMEKTNVSAKMVTNLILEKARQQRGRITILKSGTPNRLVDLARAIVSVRP